MNKNTRTLKGKAKGRFREWAINQNLCETEEEADLISFGIEVGFKIGIGVTVLLVAVGTSVSIILNSIHPVP